MYSFCQRQLGVILSLQMPQVLATDLWVFVSVRSAFAVLCNLTVLSLTNITSVLKSTFVQFNAAAVDLWQFAEEFNLLVDV